MDLSRAVSDRRQEQKRAWQIANREKVRAYSAKHKAKKRVQSKKDRARWKARNPVGYALASRARTHHVTVEVLSGMLEGQGWRCAVCGDEFGLKFHIDHDRSCCPGRRSCGACIRGLLCIVCNHLEGYLGAAMSRGVVTAVSGPMASYMARRVQS